MDAQLLADKREFIVKVYRILIYSLLYSALFAFAGVRLGISFSWWWILLELIVFVICLLVRNSLFLLYLWTSISGFTSAPILSSIIDDGQVDIIWQAILSATFLFGILTAYVHVSKRDFSHWRAILFTSLTLLILSVIPLALFPNRMAEIIWSIVGILLFSGYIVYDTSQIIHRYSRGDEVAAAFDLYLDFVNIFWDFIRIFKRTSPNPGTETTVDSPVNETDLLDTD
jgi:FtsH-binding integral membrane protein